MTSLLILSLAVPIGGALFAFAAGGRWAHRIALTTTPLGLMISIAIAGALSRSDGLLVYPLGGWRPPLGIELRADWLSVTMMVPPGLVILATGVFASADFVAANRTESRRSYVFWILLLGVWSALNL